MTRKLKELTFRIDSNHVRFLLLMNTLVSSSVHGDSTYSEVTCYNCNSYYNKSCETPDPQMIKFVTRCNITNYQEKFKKAASLFYHLLGKPFSFDELSQDYQNPSRAICLTLVLKDSKNDRVFIRSCGIDSFGAADICETFQPAEGEGGVTKTFCRHCNEMLCNYQNKSGKFYQNFCHFFLSISVYSIFSHLA